MARPAAPWVRILGGNGRECPVLPYPLAQILLSVAVVGLTCVLKLRSHTLPSQGDQHSAVRLVGLAWVSWGLSQLHLPI